MAIVKMKQVRLIGMADDRDDMLNAIRRMACVQIDQTLLDHPAPLPEGQEQPQLRQRLQEILNRPDTAALSTAREQLINVERALELLKKYAPEKGGFLQPKPTLNEAELFDTVATQAAQVTTQEIIDAERNLINARSEQLKLDDQRAQLMPWIDLELPLETGATAQTVVQMGTLPAAVPFAQAAAEMRDVAELSELTLVSTGREFQYILFVCHISQSEQALEQLKNIGWAQMNLRDCVGTVAENVARLQQRQQQLAEELLQLESRLTAMAADARPALRQLADRLVAQGRWEDARCRTLDTERTFYLEGWIPAQRVQELEQVLAPYPCAWQAKEPEPDDYPDVPVQLKNSWLTRPLNMVTEMYSLPAYGTVDPNPLMAPFFILFYGIMMADMGYGLTMLIFSMVVLSKKKPKGGTGHLFELMRLCGVSTFIMGALTGGFFGDFPTKLVEILQPGTVFVLPALFTPLDDTIMILVGSMCLGAVHILTGMAVSFYRKMRSGQVMDALWEEVTWWTVLGGAALAILGVTSLVLAVGGIMILVGAGWNEKGFGKITAVFGSLYNHVTGYFGDILSYARLMALMLAGSVIAQVFNTLGAIPGNVVIFVVVSLAGNSLNFGLNLLGCYVHDLRLQCLEYFGKFYEDGGKPFRPLNLDTKYYDVVK